MIPTSPTLLQRLKNPADHEAWTRMVFLYTPLLQEWARRSGAKGPDVNDLVQEVFVILLRELPRFDYDLNGSFRGWLKSVTVNKRMEILRRSGKDALVQSLEHSDLSVPSECDEFAEQEYRNHLVNRAWELLQTDFEPVTQAAFWQTVVLGRSTAEVAQELGVSTVVVYQAKSRVLRCLRAELAGLVLM